MDSLVAARWEQRGFVREGGVDRGQHARSPASTDVLGVYPPAPTYAWP